MMTLGPLCISGFKHGIILDIDMLNFTGCIKELRTHSFFECDYIIHESLVDFGKFSLRFLSEYLSTSIHTPEN